MANNSRIFEFTAAVRGFHVFRKIWKPVLNELLDCFHEQGNDFDYFSIKTCKKDNKKQDAIFHETFPGQPSS